MKLILYTSTSDENVIGKNLVESGQYDITFKRTNSITEPVILLYSPLPLSANYGRIEELGRYYFIDGIETLVNGIYRLSMRVDVLETYKDEILSSMGVITEQAQNVNPYYNVDYSYEVRKETDIFESAAELDEDKTLILVAIGG